MYIDGCTQFLSGVTKTIGLRICLAERVLDGWRHPWAHSSLLLSNFFFSYIPNVLRLFRVLEHPTAIMLFGVRHKANLGRLFQMKRSEWFNPMFHDKRCCRQYTQDVFPRTLPKVKRRAQVSVRKAVVHWAGLNVCMAMHHFLCIDFRVSLLPSQGSQTSCEKAIFHGPWGLVSRISVDNGRVLYYRVIPSGDPNGQQPRVRNTKT